ncbi:MAG TPA: discoidin domain-containing protein, partial [Polyangia bacterium]
MKRAPGAIATRVAFAGAIVAALAMSACRVNTPTEATSAPAGVDRQTSALTALSRTGWVLSTCTTASVCGGTLANAIDGNASTAWTTAANQATTQFFKVDTLTAHSVVGIGLDAGTSVNNFPHTYSVAVSTNDSTYTTVATGTGTTPLVNVAFGAQTARYIRISITAAASVPWSIAELNVYATALSRTGWALSASPAGTNIANAIDGSATTKWTSGVNQASGQFFQIDMLNLKSINQITLDAGTSTGEFPHALQVLVSKDGQSTTFTNVVATATGSSQLVTLSFPSVEARFLRVSLTGAASSFWSIFEINVFGSTTPATALPRTGWATAAGTKSSPAPGGGTTLANAFDGSTSTRWATGAGQAVGNFFQVDMLGSQSFNQLTLDAATSTNDYPRGFQVFVSNDGVSFGSAIASGSGTSALVTVTFPLQNARYIKITLTQAFAANWWSIAELNVYGPAFARNGWVATSSTALSSTNYQSNALDGSASTRWTTGANQANGQTFQLDMAVPETFTGLTVDAGTSTGQYPRGYQVFVSNDGTTWGSAIATGSGTTELLTIAFPVQTARYLKIVQTGSAATPWAIQELNVWRACGSGTCVASDQCHSVGVCDPVLIVCSNPVKANGTTCNDANACTTGETCQAGSCTNGTTVTCTTDQCHTVAACVPATGCPALVAKANGTTCSDGNACTQTDTCQSGVCTG